MLLVSCYNLSHLIFLHLVDIVFLVSVSVDLKAIGHLNPSLWWIKARAHSLKRVSVDSREVCGSLEGSLFQTSFKNLVLVISISFKLLWNLNLFDF